MAEVAFLVYAPLKEKRANNSFDGNANFGAYLIRDVLERAGIEVDFCRPETASEHRVVLVSMTSTYDLFAFYRAVALRPDWQPGKRAFRVVIGGFWVQNPTVVRHYADYAAFGRAEGFAAALVAAALERKPFTHPSVMNLPDLHPVTMAQVSTVYPHPVHQPMFSWDKKGARCEDFIGCQRKCRFCHYTWVRRPVNAGLEYVKSSIVVGSPELTLDQITTLKEKQGKIRTAIDGFSERLRFAYGKGITDDAIVAAMEHLGSFGGATFVNTYNIGNMPTETPEDWEALRACLGRIRIPGGAVVLILATTPFRASVLTPMQWEPMSLEPNWHNVAGQSIVREPGSVKGRGFEAVHCNTNEGPMSHLQTAVVERGTPESDKLFHALAFAPGLRHGNATNMLRLARAHFDLTPYLREYDLEERLPTWFLSSYTPAERLKAMAKKLRADARNWKGRAAA